MTNELKMEILRITNAAKAPQGKKTKVTCEPHKSHCCDVTQNTKTNVFVHLCTRPNTQERHVWQMVECAA
jgi:hypothetical protein